MIAIHDLANTWASIYSNSPAIRSALAFTHVAGLIGGGGCAIAADRATLLSLRHGADAVRAEAKRLHAVHAVVIIGLALVIASGVLLMFADLDAYLASPAF